MHDPRYSIKEKTQSGHDIRLAIYNISGRAVKKFDLSSYVHRPSHFVTWDGTDEAGKPVPGGVYFVRLETPTNNYTKKVLLLR